MTDDIEFKAEVPEADRSEQNLTAVPGDEGFAERKDSDVGMFGVREASEGDVAEQAVIVTFDDEDGRGGETE